MFRTTRCWLWLWSIIVGVNDVALCIGEVALAAVPVTYAEMWRFLLRGSGIWAMLIIAAIAILSKSYWGEWYWWDYVIICSFFVFRGVMEWVIHSWIYHANPLPIVGIRLYGEAYRQHVEHHQNPKDLARLLITYKGIVILALFTFVVSSLFFQSINLAFTMVLGLVVVGLMIEVIHLVCHSDIPHASRAMRRVVWLHRYHHKCDGKNFYGVSSSLGDRLFGTFPSHRPD